MSGPQPDARLGRYDEHSEDATGKSAKRLGELRTDLLLADYALTVNLFKDEGR